MSSSVMKALVLLLLSLVCVCRCKPTTVVRFSPVGYSPGVAPGFAYAFRASAPLYPSSVGGEGRSLLPGAGPNDVDAHTNVPTVLKTQYHSQDQLGQYAFGYVGDASTAYEIRTKDGAVRGSYTYLDSDGELQNANYVADRNGFRVEATNLPKAPPVPVPTVISLPQPVKPTPEVEAATAAHLRAVEEVRAARIKRAAPTTTYISSLPSIKLPFMRQADAVKAEPSHVPARVKKVLLPATLLKKASAASALTPSVSHELSHQVSASVPTHVAASHSLPTPPAGARASPASVLVAGNSVLGAPVVAPSQILLQVQTQDELGRYEYIYEGEPSSHYEAGTPDGNALGSYAYIDAIGELQEMAYVADDLYGFRELARSLAEGPADTR